MLREVRTKKTYMGRLRRGDDLLQVLTTAVEKQGVRLGRIEGLGAVERASVGYYDQQERQYRYLELEREMEILSLIGNVSIRDGKPMVHAHITLGDDRGGTFGGHLAIGTRVFACEYFLDIFEGEDLVRTDDAETGLPLWPEDS